MRLNIKGSTNKKQMVEQFINMLNTLDDLGVEEYMNVNLYVTPLAMGKRVQLAQKGKPLDITLNGDGDLVSTIPTTDSNQPFVIDTTGRLKGSDKLSLVELSDFSAKEILKAHLADQRKAETEIKKNRATQRQRIADKLATGMQERKQKTACYHALLSKLGIDSREFRERLGNSGFIRTASGVRAYTDQDIGSPVIRFSLLDGEHGERKTFIYSTDAELLYESGLDNKPVQ